MSVQSNPQLKLKFGNLDIAEFEMNGVKLIYQETLSNLSKFIKIYRGR